jgi:hypothetical protein
MIHQLKRAWERLSVFGESSSGRKLLRLAKYLIQVVIVLILAGQIIQIGWRNILSELPVQPLYYLLFLVLYFTLPVTEYFTYSVRWPIRFWESQGIFLKKRIYNKVVLGYSGEVQLFFWLKSRMGIDKTEAYEVVRDNNILSTLASTSVAFVLLVIFMLTGRLRLDDWVTLDQLYLMMPVGLALLSAVLLLLRRFRAYLFTMSRKPALLIFSLHCGRMLFLTAAQVAQWYVVMPWVAFDIWFTMIVLQLILSRIPFLPSKDLVFIGTSLEFVRHAGVSAAGIAGLLLVNQVLDKLMNLAIFAMLSLQERREKA